MRKVLIRRKSAYYAKFFKNNKKWVLSDTMLKNTGYWLFKKGQKGYAYYEKSAYYQCAYNNLWEGTVVTINYIYLNNIKLTSFFFCSDWMRTHSPTNFSFSFASQNLSEFLSEFIWLAAEGAFSSLIRIVSFKVSSIFPISSSSTKLDCSFFLVRKILGK